jgi:inhibitor of the pro-sigma K processing machinery
MSIINVWILLFVVGVVVFMIMNRSIKQPLQWMIYGLLYTAVGGIVLFLVNLLGQQFSFHIPINPITAMITGVLGLPGFLCLVAVRFFVL